MRDNRRRYRAIRDAFTPGYPGQPSGTVARHLIPRAARLSGIVGRKSPHLPHIAAQGPNGTTPESRATRCARWCDHAHLLEEGYFLPSVDVWRRHRALQTVVLVMDGRGGGRGWTARRIHVVSQGRALPLAWRVRQAPKGHVPADLHMALVELRRAVMPEGAQVVLVGDGACAGTAVHATVQEAGWASACRTAMSPVATGEGETCRLETLGAWRTPGTRVACKEGQCTREA